jgi:DNA processing protein
VSAAQELIARVRLSLAIEPGDGAVSDSVSSVGAARTVEELLDGDERPELVARLRTVDPERVLAVADRQRVRFVTPADDEWPSQLDDLAHGQRVQGLGGVPVGLWVRGPMRLSDLSESVAVPEERRSLCSRAAPIVPIPLPTASSSTTSPSVTPWSRRRRRAPRRPRCASCPATG